ncbi:MAG TPA: heavy metal translocating P-type ATPase [Rickettsiales bacterium]|nr:heavy metal translocating P-type ATPase [Rickettsiales bacterium]
MKKHPTHNIKSYTPPVLLWDWTILFFGLAAIGAHYVTLHMALPSIYHFQAADIPLIVVAAVGGIPLAFQILWKLLRGNLGADLLAALALATGVWLGQYLAAVLIVIMLAGGQALEYYAMRKASSVLLALAGRMPSITHRKKGETLEEIAIADIGIGDEITVLPHETVPVDGTVVEGNGSMDESYLTGEPYRIAKAPGASVISGAINGESAITIRAEKLPSDSRYAQIMQVMQDAEQKRPTMRRIGDQIGAVFAPLALLTALAAWYFSGDSVRFLAVLVVATPCPLLIAIPVTLISAISIAAKRSIIIKDPTVLERLPTCRTAIFDKTGTLTYGKPVLTEIIPAAGVLSHEILQQAASLEYYSKHPLAGAILDAAEKEKLPALKTTSVSEKPGQGLTGRVAEHEMRVTHRKQLLGSAPDIASMLPPTAAGLECVILRDGQYAATFRFRDAPRNDSKSFVSHLEPSHQFSKIILLSGDRASEVEYLAGVLGIQETLSSQAPEQKVAIVRAETVKAPTFFMGDGINDAPALASATVGVAFGQHSSVTSEAAGAVILENTLTKVDELLHISIAMRRIVLQSAIGGMGLSLIAMGFAAAGLITPVAGALLQEAIDVLAIVNALRLAWSDIRSDMQKRR